MAFGAWADARREAARSEAHALRLLGAWAGASKQGCFAQWRVVLDERKRGDKVCGPTGALEDLSGEAIRYSRHSTSYALDA